MFKLSAAGATLVLAGTLGGQTPRKIDFGKDVQPIFQASCVSCHGPAQQMAGFRLDQRRYAMPNRVGANGARIVPGDSGRSRLYQKIVGNAPGLRMPPTGPLSQEQIGIVKAWIDQNAEWPDELSGETPRLPPDPKATEIMQAIRNGNRERFENQPAVEHHTDLHADAFAGHFFEAPSRIILESELDCRFVVSVRIELRGRDIFGADKRRHLKTIGFRSSRQFHGNAGTAHRAHPGEMDLEG